MGLLHHSTDLSVKYGSDDDVDDDKQTSFYLATNLNFHTEPLCDNTTYDDDVPLDEELSINLRFSYIRLDTDILKHYFLRDDNNNEDEDAGPKEAQIESSTLKTFRRPIQGFPTSYEETWQMVYKWVEEEFEEELGMVQEDTYVLPVLTEELAYWASYIVGEIPRGRKMLSIDLCGTIREVLVSRPPTILTCTNSFITEVAVWQTVDPFKCINNKFKDDDKKEPQLDEELVINVYSSYKPIDVDTSICKVYKCRHPANELWDVENRVLKDVVSLMLKQVDLPGEYPHLCLLNETIQSVKRFFYNYCSNKELNAIVRITEVVPPPAASNLSEDDFTTPCFPRLSLPPNLLLMPLRSSHIRKE